MLPSQRHLQFRVFKFGGRWGEDWEVSRGEGWCYLWFRV